MEKNYVVTIKMYVQAETIDHAKIQVMENMTESIDWHFERVQEDMLESLKRQNFLDQLSQ